MLFKQQQGATLITSLLLLVVMTILGVSSMRVSILDSLLAKNEHESMIMFQQAETKLTEFVSPARAMQLILKNTENQKFTHRELYEKTTQAMTHKPDMTFMCQGSEGKARTIDENNGGICQIVEFEVIEQLLVGGARDHHLRGTGKEMPDINGKYNLL